MSEYGIHITLCDMCYPGLQPMHIPAFGRNAIGLDDRGTPIRGVFWGGFDLAMEAYGWEERDWGHLCPECVAEEKAQEEYDEKGGTVAGATDEGVLNSTVEKMLTAEQLLLEKLVEERKGVTPEVNPLTIAKVEYEPDPLSPLTQAEILKLADEVKEALDRKASDDFKWED